MESANNTLVVLISTLGGIVTTYLTVKYKDKVFKPKIKTQPISRIDTIFDGYEKLIQQQQLDIERKALFIEHLQKAVDQLRSDLDKTEDLLNDTRTELDREKARSEQLQSQLSSMKKDYNEGRTVV